MSSYADNMSQVEAMLTTLQSCSDPEVASQIAQDIEARLQACERILASVEGSFVVTTPPPPTALD